MTFTIADSYKTRSRAEMCDVIRKNKSKHPVPAPLYFRSVYSLVDEWRAHNLLYDLHLFRNHTKDVDFEYPQRWYLSIIWAFLSIFYRP